MRSHVTHLGGLLFALISAFQAGAQLPAPKPIDPNPWNGSWRLSVQRSSPVAAEPGVPQVYKFTLGPGSSSDVAIKWEIPELGEVVAGRTNDVAMPVVRTKPAPGLKLAVRTDGSASLLYSIFRDTKLVGGGRMMLIDNGTAWVDLTWPADRQDLASALVYVRE